MKAHSLAHKWDDEGWKNPRGGPSHVHESGKNCEICTSEYQANLQLADQLNKRGIHQVRFGNDPNDPFMLTLRRRINQEVRSGQKKQLALWMLLGKVEAAVIGLLMVGQVLALQSSRADQARIDFLLGRQTILEKTISYLKEQVSVASTTLSQTIVSKSVVVEEGGVEESDEGKGEVPPEVRSSSQEEIKLNPIRKDIPPLRSPQVLKSSSFNFISDLKGNPVMRVDSFKPEFIKDLKMGLGKDFKSFIQDSIFPIENVENIEKNLKVQNANLREGLSRENASLRSSLNVPQPSVDTSKSDFRTSQSQALPSGGKKSEKDGPAVSQVQDISNIPRPPGLAKPDSGDVRQSVLESNPSDNHPRLNELKDKLSPSQGTLKDHQS
ncbi:MAG: hypothetical protein HYS08_08875 [Chlamydiae bacterium]|nr:hypothetical protein [Chlamydiota bacterium]MBI3265476.1 hypothetical protein [Chlamydiota bacterium]